MKARKIVLLGAISVLAIALAACGHSSDTGTSKEEHISTAKTGIHETQEPIEKKESESTSSTSPSETTSTSPSTEEKQETTATQNNAMNTPDSTAKTDTPANSASEEKQHYLEKLKSTKEEMDILGEKSQNAITYEAKGYEGDRFDTWDALLNDIYQTLSQQLSSSEMEKLRKEQLNWITYRDKTAKEASDKYNSGTGATLEYVRVENKLTEERCFALVQNYMK